MKNLIYVLLLIVVFSACDSNINHQTNDSTTVSQPITNDSQELIKTLKPFIQGVWVKKDYIEKITKTKSPLAAADLANGITTMYINTDKIIGDSLTFSVGYGNHEGGDLTLKFKDGKIIADNYEIKYSVTKNDTTLNLYYTENNKTSKTEYVKALNKQGDDLGYGMDITVNKSLIAGKYIWQDNMVLQEVIFSDDGKVKGLPNVSTYSIFIDLNSDPMTNLDEIGFDIFTKHHSAYAYKINKDTLNLYNTRPNADSTELIITDLKYKLTRTK